LFEQLADWFFLHSTLLYIPIESRSDYTLYHSLFAEAEGEFSMAGNIIVVGSINMDLVVRAPRHPQPGETILGSSFHTFPGGKGANQAVAAARAGGHVRMVGRVGDDDFGSALLQTLQNDGVDTHATLRTPGVASGVALITVSDAGQNNIVVIPGSNGKLAPGDLQAAQEVFADGGAVLVQLEIPLETVLEAARLARLSGAKLILNPAPARQLPDDLLRMVDYLIPNEHELTLLTGEQDILRAARQLKCLGVGCVIVTLGGEGVLVLEGDQPQRLPSHTVQVMDTTAAGDAFVGAFAVALTEGKSTLDAARWGNAAGALAVTKAGAQPSLPKREEIMELS
jgi:ribokinase